MERKHKITVPKPCHENWNKMTPSENGRFCLSCSKTVVDFTSMLPEEVQHFFIQNQNNKVCGRFNKSQLDAVTIQIPSRVLYAQTNYYKMFLLALFVAMGTTLFSCADKDGNKKKIDKVEVVENASETPHVTVGVALPPKHDPKDTLKHVPPPPPPKVDQVKFVKPEETNIKSVKTNSKKNNTSKEIIYTTGEVASQTNAEFPGGIDQFYTFFGKEFVTPEGMNTKNLKIKISFAVEKDGSMSYIQSEPVIDKTIEQEIIRVLKSSPKWQPGQLDGKKTKMQYSLPIAF